MPVCGSADLLFLDLIIPGSVYVGLVGKPKGRDHLENLDLDGRLILKWILKKQSGRGCTGFIWLRVGTGRGAVLNTVMDFRIKKQDVNFCHEYATVSPRKRACFELKILIILTE